MNGLNGTSALSASGARSAALPSPSQAPREGGPLDQEIIFSLIANIKDNQPIRRQCPIREFLKSLAIPHFSESKESVKLFALTEFKPGSTRTDANAIRAFGFACDVDNSTTRVDESGKKTKACVDNPLLFDEAVLRLRELNCIAAVYPTFNYSPTWPRFRIIVFFSKALGVTEFGLFARTCQGWLGRGVDSRPSPSFFAYKPNLPYGSLSPNAMILDTGTLLDTEEFVSKHTALENPGSVATTTRPPQAIPKPRPVDLDRLGFREGDNFRSRLIEPVVLGHRSDHLFSVIAEATRRGADEKLTFDLLMSRDLGVSEKPLERGAAWTWAEVQRVREKLSADNKARLERVTKYIAEREFKNALDDARCGEVAQAHALTMKLDERWATIWARDVKTALKPHGLSARELDKLLGLAARSQVIRRDESPNCDEGADLFSDYVPWDEPVSAREAIEAVLEILKRFVALEDSQRLVVACWVLASWRHQDFSIFPLLHLTSPQPGCGKSTLGELLSIICPRGWMFIHPSLASLYRSISHFKPTAILDEVDAISEDSELPQLLNGAHSRATAKVPRFNADANKTEIFNLYTPIVLCGIGELHKATLASRAVRVEMQVADARLARLSRERPAVVDVHRKLKRWAVDCGALQASEMLDRVLIDAGFQNRPLDLWEPLALAAQAAGEDFLAQIVEIAKVRNRKDAADERTASDGQLLLKDLRILFDEMLPGELSPFEGIDSPSSTTSTGPKNSSAVDFGQPITRPWADNAEHLSVLFVVSQLTQNDRFSARQWQRYRFGKPLGASDLAKLLKGYGIKSVRKSEPRDEAGKRGQSREELQVILRVDLDPVWQRYLAAPK